MPGLATKQSDVAITMTATWESTDIAARHAYWLREQAYVGPNKRKRIAKDWDVSEALARGWLEGKIPASRHLVKMIARWGAAYVGFVFEPCGQWAREISMIDRIQRAAAEADAIKAELEKLRTP